MRVYKSLTGYLLFLTLNINNSYAQIVLDEIHFTGDIDQSIPGTSGTIFNSNDTIIVFDFITNTASSNNDLGILDHVGIDGYHKQGDGCGSTLYSLDNTTVISGTAMRAADIFTATGVKILDAKIAGIPDGININAVTRDSSTCDLIVSIDSASILSGIAFKPDDLINWDGSNFSLYGATGFNVNIDALHILSPNRMLISIDVGNSMPDIDVYDEDIMEISIGVSPFQLLSFEPAIFNASWQAADVNALWALPKPIVDFMFANGFENP